MAKKPTIRQLEETVNMLTRQLNFALRMVIPNKKNLLIK